MQFENKEPVNGESIQHALYVQSEFIELLSSTLNELETKLADVSTARLSNGSVGVDSVKESKSKVRDQIDYNSEIINSLTIKLQNIISSVEL